MGTIIKIKEGEFGLVNSSGNLYKRTFPTIKKAEKWFALNHDVPLPSSRSRTKEDTQRTAKRVAPTGLDAGLDDEEMSPAAAAAAAASPDVAAPVAPASSLSSAAPLPPALDPLVAREPDVIMNEERGRRAKTGGALPSGEGPSRTANAARLRAWRQKKNQDRGQEEANDRDGIVGEFCRTGKCPVGYIYRTPCVKARYSKASE